MEYHLTYLHVTSMTCLYSVQVQASRVPSESVKKAYAPSVLAGN